MENVFIKQLSSHDIKSLVKGSKQDDLSNSRFKGGLNTAWEKWLEHLTNILYPRKKLMEEEEKTVRKKKKGNSYMLLFEAVFFLLLNVFVFVFENLCTQPGGGGTCL